MFIVSQVVTQTARQTDADKHVVNVMVHFWQISILNMLKKYANKIMPAPCDVTIDVNIPTFTD
jgi:hypothetical protein